MTIKLQSSVFEFTVGPFEQLRLSSAERERGRGRGSCGWACLRWVWSSSAVASRVFVGCFLPCLPRSFWAKPSVSRIRPGRDSKSQFLTSKQNVNSASVMHFEYLDLITNMWLKCPHVFTTFSHLESRYVLKFEQVIVFLTSPTSAWIHLNECTDL